MKDKLRELAERWSHRDYAETDHLQGYAQGIRQASNELLEIIDAEGDGGAVQIPELRIGAPAWPGQREGKAPPEGWVHVSVNNLADLAIHSPDAADSGRVTRLDIAAIDLLREIDSHREWVKSGSVLQAAQRMKLALAAQGKGEAVAATDADIAEWAERHDLNFGGSKTDARTAFEDAESYRRAHAASPAGVPDGERSDVWVVQDENGQPIHCASWPLACHEHINDAINEHGIEEAKAWKVLHYSSSATIPSAPAKHCDRGPDDCVQCSVLAGTFAVKSAAPSATPEGGEMGS